MNDGPIRTLIQWLNARLTELERTGGGGGGGISAGTGDVTFSGSGSVVTAFALAVSHLWQAPQNVTPSTLTDSANIAPNGSLSNNFYLLTTAAIGGTRNLAIPTGLSAGSIVNLEVAQPASGGPCAIVFAAGYKWGKGGQDPQPIGSTVASAVDTYSFQVQANGNLHGVMIGQSGPTGAGYTATSTTSLTPSVASKALTTQAGLAYTIGARARATSASTGDYFEGLVASYVSGVLTINADTFSGVSARTDWNINLAGNPGTAGATGSQGIPGAAGSGNGVNLQTGTTYTYVSGDASKLVSHTNAASIAATLPQAAGSFASPFVFDVENRGVGTLTITPTTSTIDGASSLALTTNQGCTIYSDGTNWFTQRGASGGASATTGTFTPVIIGTTTAGTGTYTAQVGRYQRVGRIVTFSLNISWTAHTGTGSMQVSGLPFTPVAFNTCYPIFASGLTFTPTLTALSVSGDTVIQLFSVQSGAVGTIAIDAIVAGMTISGSYEV